MFLQPEPGRLQKTADLGAVHRFHFLVEEFPSIVREPELFFNVPPGDVIEFLICEAGYIRNLIGILPKICYGIPKEKQGGS